MARTHRVPTIVALIVCLLGGPGGGSSLFAADEALPPMPIPPPVAHSPFTFTDQIWPVEAARAQAWQGRFDFVPAGSTLLAQRRGFRGRGRRGGGGSAAAIVIGAAAVIAGAAVLVYANRPDCRANVGAEGCGYGTKVAGGAVLAAGAVGIVVGSLTWR